VEFNIRRGQNTWRFDPVDRLWTVVTQNRQAQWVPPVAADTLGNNPFVDDDFALPFLDEAVSGNRRAVALPSPTPSLAIEDPPPVFQPFQAEGALGAHELIVPLLPGVDARDAAALSAGELSTDSWEAMWTVLRRRLWALSNDRRFHQARVLFPAQGQRKLQHPHLHLLALPLPTDTWPKSACPVCADVQHARDRGRVVATVDDVTAWVPFAPKGALHVRIGADAHVGWMQEDDLSHKDTCSLLRRVTQAVEGVSGGLDVCVAGAQVPLNSNEGGHFLLDVFVPYDKDAVFRDIGVRVCPTSPERLAQLLRDWLHEA